MTQLRADAQRNLDRVLEAAAETFAEQGIEASVDEIARRAGVGHATVFRRFPTKDALVAAIVLEHLAELTSVAQEAARSEDAGEAFDALVLELAATFARDRALFEGMAGTCLESREGRAAKRALLAAVEEVAVRAQEAGVVRRDVSTEDVLRLIPAVISASLPLTTAEPEAWRRYLAVVLDGLRPLSPSQRA